MENVPNEGYYGGSDVPLCAAFDGESKMFSKKSKYEKIVRSDFTIKREVSPDAIDPDFLTNTNNNSKNGKNATNGENSSLLGRVIRKFLKTRYLKCVSPDFGNNSRKYSNFDVFYDKLSQSVH